MPDRLVVSNTSPLLYLHQIDLLSLLEHLYGRVFIPPAVRTELLNGQRLGHSVPAIDELTWIEVKPVDDLHSSVELTDLGAGEFEAIGLALSLPGSLLILDEALGRRAAVRAGIELTGTIGVLIKAKQRGFLARVKPALEALLETTMYLDPDLLRRALHLSGEL